MPLATFGQWRGDALHLRCAYGEMGEEVAFLPSAVLHLARAEGRQAVYSLQEARELGARVAADLKRQLKQPLPAAH